MTSKTLEFYENESLPDPEIDAERQDELNSAPMHPQALIERLDEHHSSSPAD